MEESRTIEIRLPDDWHVHLRDDEMLATVAPLTARTFRYALVMPNLVPPIRRTAEAREYRDRIMASAGAGALVEFTPIMALYLADDLDLDDLQAGFEEGVIHAVKYYPAGATTNSEHGGSSLMGAATVLERMTEIGMPLLVHAESTDPDVDIFDRERDFLDRQLAPVVSSFPSLAVTVEHLSTKAGVDFVTAHEQVRGSITPHHLSCDRSDLLANGLRPDLYCKPIINSAADREALVAAATSGAPSFFLGTDSAPHPNSHKHGGAAKPGIFNAPYALPVVAEVFYRSESLDQLEAFVSLNGCRAYGFEPATRHLRLTRSSAGNPPEGEGKDVVAPIVDSVETSDGETVRIFGAEEAARWTVTVGAQAISA